MRCIRLFIQGHSVGNGAVLPHAHRNRIYRWKRATIPSQSGFIIGIHVLTGSSDDFSGTEQLFQDTLLV